MGINPSIYLYGAHSVYSKIFALYSMLGFKYYDLFMGQPNGKLAKRKAEKERDREKK